MLLSTLPLAQSASLLPLPPLIVTGSRLPPLSSATRIDEAAIEAAWETNLRAISAPNPELAPVISAIIGGLGEVWGMRPSRAAAF